jgi:hypothetical protein
MFPSHTGMNRYASFSKKLKFHVPRRAGMNHIDTSEYYCALFVPRPRGDGPKMCLFLTEDWNIPRPRGDEPFVIVAQPHPRKRSPHARG